MRLFYLFYFWVASVSAFKHLGFTYSAKVVSSCNFQILRTLTFCDPVTEECACSNMNYLATMMGCAVAYEANLTEFKGLYQEFCVKVHYPMKELSLLDLALNHYEESAVETSEIPDFDPLMPLAVPIILDDKERALFAKSFFTFLGNINTSIAHGVKLINFWGIVLLSAILANWSRILLPKIVFKFNGRITNLWRKNITLPAAYGTLKNQSYNWGSIQVGLIPSRWETIVVVLFTIFTIALNLDIPLYSPGDLLFPRKSDALLRYTADMTGITATFLMPLLILFAGRNNLLCFITRIHYNTFITYHKWIARIVTFMITIHAVNYTIIVSKSGYSHYIVQKYFFWGVVSLIMMSFLCGLAFLHLRRRWYETFLVIHIVLAVILMVGGYYHVTKFGYAILFHASVAFWALDRVLRIARLAWFGVVEANVTVLADETLRVVVPRPKGWPYIAGGYVFIHFLQRDCFWQSHPFTYTELPNNSEVVILYCKIKGGVTQKIYQHLQQFPGSTGTIKVTLEGPYGEAAPVEKHESAVFIAGGNGIPGLYSEVIELLKHERQKEGTETTALLESGRRGRQVIKLYWIIRDYRTLEWFYEEFMAIKDSKVQIVVYVTKSTEEELDEWNHIHDNTTKNDINSTNSSEYGDDSVLTQMKANLTHIKFRRGRPNISKIVETEIEESTGPTGFITCGHLVMVDEIRQAVVENVDKGKGNRVDFFEQIETWA